MDQQFRQQLGYLQQQMRQIEGHNARLRSEYAAMQRQIDGLSSLGQTTMRGVGQDGGGSNGGSSWVAPKNPSEHTIRYIESIPGRRIPYDLVVDIPIGANITSLQQQTVMVTQDGPFVAVARIAAFQSAFQFNVRDPVTSALATFQGRSFGRWRPVSSTNDFADAGGILQPVAGLAFPGTGAAIVASPSNHSGFRTMQFDGVIEMLNQGSAFPRMNQAIASAFWGDICSPFQLGALDFFERGEFIQFKVTPTHPNNPAFGNASAYAAGGLYPFLDSQYDVHEGVVDALNPAATGDPVTRQPDGILQLGLHGFRIIQPPGAVRMT